MAADTRQTFSAYQTNTLVRDVSFLSHNSRRSKQQDTLGSIDDIKPMNRHTSRISVTSLSKSSNANHSNEYTQHFEHKEMRNSKSSTTSPTPNNNYSQFVRSSTGSNDHIPWDNNNAFTSQNNNDRSVSTLQSSHEKSPARSRTKEHILDSIGVVKIAPIGNFEDIKLEAMNSWGEGVDLKLKYTETTKKKTEWLNENDFFSKQIVAATSSTSVVKNNEKNAPTWNDSSIPANGTTQPRGKKHVEGRKTPDWALDDTGSGTSQANVPYGYQKQAWAPPPHKMQHHVAPLVMMPSPYVQLQPALLPQHSPRDNEYLTIFYKVVRDREVPSTITGFKKKVEKYLHRYIHEYSPRTFAMFLEALVVLIEYEASLHEVETVSRVREAWNMFLFYFTRHLQCYAKLPEDLLPALSLCANLQRYAPKIYKNLPIKDTVRVYGIVKDLCTPKVNRECLQHLRFLNAIPDEMATSWRDQDEILPNVPTAESVISEVVHGINALTNYEAKKEVSIKNRAHNPWPKVDLLEYILVHFMMLREEFLKPVQSTIEELFSGKPSGTMNLPHSCAVYENVTPISTTIAMTSSEPAIVFKLGPTLQHDAIMESFDEGSLVVLLPEVSTSISPADRHTVMTKMMKDAMMGHSLRASSLENSHNVNRVVSIQINRDDISRLNFSSTYTVITCHINSSTAVSVLKWLHKEYVGLKKEGFSPVLTPRILVANNTLSKTQLTDWDEENIENSLAINQDSVPDYLVGVEIDVSCIMAGRGHNQKARPGERIWPRYSSQWENIAQSKRPLLYNISNSQVDAVQYAMRHRIAVISGAPGTGKTHIASKLAQLMSEALSVGQFHQPVLIITKSQSCLDDILTKIIPNMSDVIRFGPYPWDEVLVGKQATKIAAPTASDSNHRQHQTLERQLSKNQIKLNALMLARFQVTNHDPSVLSTAVAPIYFQCLQEGYLKEHRYTPNSLTVWNAWASEDPKTRDYTFSQAAQKKLEHAQFNLESTYLKKCGRGLMPMVDISVIQSRFNWVANNPIAVSSIADSVHWPFENSTRTGHSLRSALLEAWKRVPADRIWNVPQQEKTKLIESLANVLISYIDDEIHDVMRDQLKTAKAFDANLIQKWTYLCRFNRVVGMTADFAAAHRDWVSTLWPRAVIVDEASEILESTLASTILGPRTEHLVLLGNSDNLSKPHLTNPDMAGNPRNLDVSLFERWKGSNGRIVLLEEQHRMHSKVATIIDQFNSIKSKESSLLITAPLASCSENMVDGSDSRFEELYGITQRAYYVNYKQQGNKTINRTYSDMLQSDITEDEVDEARYVAFLAVYVSQQPYPAPQITILTTCLLQKYLIRAILRAEVPNRTTFKSNVSKISLDTIEQNNGRQDAFSIISTATPSHSYSTWDNVNRALTRSKYGVFVIGKPDQDRVHSRWSDFAKYMGDRGLNGQELQVSCYVHGDVFSVGKWQDFDQIKNGGCSRPCRSLMSDGHVCPEVCHFMSHDEVVCTEPCNRIRPSRCTHLCTQKCFECSKNGCCPPCEEEASVKLGCGHVSVGVCASIQTADAIRCEEIVTIQLPCGHETSIACNKARKPSKTLECNVQEEVTLDCGHTAIKKCNISPVCSEICSQRYECGHRCTEMCGVTHSHDRKQCSAECPKQLICGHNCANGCANPDKHTERCMESCNYICAHGYNCSRVCYKDCIRCVSQCPYRCDHYKCTKKCFEICDRPPCNKPCKLRLQCSHQCPGLCGEPCPPCVICQGSIKCPISLRTLSEFEKNDKVYVLPECGCVFLVESLDMYFQNQAKNGEHTAVKLWGCPKCSKTIYCAFRYNKYIKTEIALVNTIKLRLEQERQQLTYQEREQIISAMNDETHQGIHNMVGGRWFVCENQHPYFIGDCGGATQVSNCPECDAPIGGTMHKIFDSNRFYGEFDNSKKPAWPGQPGIN